MKHVQTVNSNEVHDHRDELGLARIARLSARPKSIQETGLSREFLVDLVAKHLLEKGAMSLADLASSVALTGTVVERLLEFMRAEAYSEVKPAPTDDASLRYALTDRGRSLALDAMMRSGYVGPAPVTTSQYSRIVRAQSIHSQTVTREAMYRAFHDTVIEQSLLDRLGASVNSGRAIFLYGDAGTGKTYISQRLSRLFPGLILVPHAIAVDNQVIQIYDPLVHKAVDVDSEQNSHLLDRGHDRRFVVCERPSVVTAGELNAEMLEVVYEPGTRLYEAPMQLRANNGVFIIDDLGRQRIEPKQIFNRWIVPLEERVDYLALKSGRHFTVPFDVTLIFSTNIHPLELADEAFLRRIGYKIEFTPLTPEAYSRVWHDTCVELDVEFDAELLQFVINDLHGKHKTALLPCHPRDLISMALDNALYIDNNRCIDREKLHWAWTNYFVQLKDAS